MSLAEEEQRRQDNLRLDAEEEEALALALTASLQMSSEPAIIGARINKEFRINTKKKKVP